MFGNTSFHSTGNTSFYPTDEDVPIELCSPYSFDHLIATCYLISFILSLVGNILVVCTLFRFEDPKSVSRLFFLCLASFDLLFTLTLPFWAVYFLHHWVFGEAACKIVSGAFYTGQWGSLLLLMAMTLDRFCTVVLKGRPLTQPGRRLQCARVVCVATWLISIAASIREGLNSQTGEWEGGMYCVERDDIDEDEKKITFYIQAVFFFLLPLTVIVFCYGCILRKVLSVPHMRGRQRTVWLLFCIIMAFFVCFVPYNVLLHLMNILDMSKCQKLVLAFFEISRILAYCHCVVNPILHMLRPRFRSMLYQVICCMNHSGHPVSQSHVNPDAVEMHSGYKTPVTLEMTLEHSESRDGL